MKLDTRCRFSWRDGAWDDPWVPDSSRRVSQPEPDDVGLFALLFGLGMGFLAGIVFVRVFW